MRGKVKQNKADSLIVWYLLERKVRLREQEQGTILAGKKCYKVPHILFEQNSIVRCKKHGK